MQMFSFVPLWVLVGYVLNLFNGQLTGAVVREEKPTVEYVIDEEEFKEKYR